MSERQALGIDINEYSRTGGINYARVKDFVQESLAGTVHGFVSSLKFVDEIEEIELRIKIQKK